MTHFVDSIIPVVAYIPIQNGNLFKSIARNRVINFAIPFQMYRKVSAELLKRSKDEQLLLTVSQISLETLHHRNIWLIEQTRSHKMAITKSLIVFPHQQSLISSFFMMKAYLRDNLSDKLRFNLSSLSLVAMQILLITFKICEVHRQLVQGFIDHL